MFSANFFRLSLLLALLFQFQNELIAQDDYIIVTRDLEVWSSTRVKYKVNKKLTFGLNQGLRLNTNASNIDQVLTELGMKYSPNKSLTFASDFRYIANKGGNGEFDNDFRFNIDIGYKHKIDRFNLKYRLRYQNKNELGFSKADGDDFENVFRLKVAAEYNIKNWKLDPQLSVELFRNIWLDDASFDRIRFSFETDYSIKKIGNLNPFYRIERELSQSYPKTTYIIGLNYTYTIKNKK